jgi:hypothetical protein
MNELLAHYMLLVPGFLLLEHGPEALSLLFLAYFALAAVALPRGKRPLRAALKAFPAFCALLLLASVAMLAAADVIFALVPFSPYVTLLAVLPLYALLRQLTVPWFVLERGISAPMEAWKAPAEDGWLVLAGISALAVANALLPMSALLLAAPVSYYLSSNLRLSRGR